MAVTVGGAVVVAGLAAGALVRSPALTQLQRDIAAGQAAIDAAGQDGAAAPGAVPSPPRPDGGSPNPTGVYAPQRLTEPLPPSTVGPDTLVIGDSVTVASAASLLAELPGAEVDASVGHQIWDAVDEVRRDERDGRLRRVVVVALGTNGAPTSGQLDQILETIGPDRQLVLVLPHGSKPWIPAARAAMQEFAAAHPEKVGLADWGDASSLVTEWAPDGIHPRGNGSALFGRLVRLAVEDASGRG